MGSSRWKKIRKLYERIAHKARKTFRIPPARIMREKDTQATDRKETQ